MYKPRAAEGSFGSGLSLFSRLTRQLLHRRPDTETLSQEKLEENCSMFAAHSMNCFLRLICLGRTRYFLILLKQINLITVKPV